MIVNLRCGEAGAAKSVFEFLGTSIIYVSIIIRTYVRIYNIIMIEAIYIAIHKFYRN